MPFTIGENVGPYRVIEQLGQGGMATVYKAFHAALERYVALKVLHPAFLEDPNFLARFKREAKLIAKLEHPNIVPVYDFAEHRGQPYLVLKFIEGETLKARLQRGQLSREEGTRVVEAVGAALAYAHRQGVLHRDIKPSNVLLARDGGIYLADFGLARMAQAGASTLSTDMMMGTPHYISPEQARGERELDEGTDIYSMGVVLYEFIVGRVPFSSDTPFSIIHDHIYTPLPPPTRVNPRVPPAMEMVLLKALAKDRADRYLRVEDLVAAYRGAMPEGAVGAMPETVAAAVTAPPSTRPAAVRPEAAVPDSGARRTGTGPAATTGSRPPAPAPAAKKSRTWVWALAGLALTCVCITAFLAVSNLGRQQEEAQPSTPAGEVVAPQPQELEAAVQEAQAAVQANPGDPGARLNLAHAYGAQGDVTAASGQLAKAGDLFLQQMDFPAAAAAYAEAVVLAGGPEAADRGLANALMQSLFLGAASQPTWGTLDMLFERYPEWAMLAAPFARARVYQGDVGAAHELLESVFSNNPEDPYATAVLAEIALRDGNVPEARGLAQRAMDQPRVPEWLVRHLRGLLDRMGAP